MYNKDCLVEYVEEDGIVGRWIIPVLEHSNEITIVTKNGESKNNKKLCWQASRWLLSDNASGKITFSLFAWKFEFDMHGALQGPMEVR